MMSIPWRRIIFVAVVFLSIMTTHATAADATGVHAYRVQTMDGDWVSLDQFAGKALLIVNTASRCGYTPQYGSLERLYQTYKQRGFEVLAFPANNFGGQEPGSNQDIEKFCRLEYRTTFPVFAKSSVRGDDINELYKYLTELSDFRGDVTWNFNKFLVNPGGQVGARFGSPVDPLDPKVIAGLEKILPEDE